MTENDSEREPLLKQQKQNHQQQQNRVEQSKPVQIKEQSEISPLIRALVALRSGHLPDNAQLYALLHSSAAFCETLSGSVIPSESKKNSQTQNDDDDQAAALSNETIITLAALLKECATLCRISAGWLYGNENDRDGKMTRSKDTQTDSNQQQGAKGNENEQWQRMIWHLGQSLIEKPVEVEMESDLTTDAQEAANAIKQTAKQVQTDAIQGFKSITKIISMILSSDEFLRIPSDIVGSISGTLAGIANDVGARAFEVEEALETSKVNDEEKTEKDFLYPKEAIQDAGGKAADAVEAIVNEPQPGRKGKQKRSQEDENEITWQDEFAKRIARLLTEVREDDTFRNATEKIVGLTRKYMSVAKEIRDDVQVNIEQEGSLGEAAVQGVDEVREGIATKIESVHLETEISTHLSFHATATLQAAKEVLEGLAGGRSLNAVLEKAEIVKEQAQSDSELRQWVDQALDLIANTIRPTENSNEESIQKQIRSLFDQLHILLNTRPAIVRSYEDLQIAWSEFQASLRSDVMMRKIRARVQHIISMSKTVFVNGIKDAKEQAKFAFSTLIKSLLPSIGQILGNIPLPRVEFTSDNLDAVVDDVHISSLQLVPDTLRLTTKTDWMWQSNETHVDSDFRVFIGGLKLAVSDVSFYVQERFTAPSETTCFSCCSFGKSKSNWCLCRGPSSWLAYTESALLDVGFQRKGVGVILDLRDAGQDIRKESANSSSSWWSPWSSSQNKRHNQLDDIIKQCQSSEEQAEIEEKSIRTSFFDINDCQVEIDDSFDLNLRNSRHWLINTFLRYTSRPIIKTVLRRIISAQIRNGFILADKRAYDIHLRAKLIRHRKLCQEAKRAGQQTLPSLSHAFAGISDYVAVIIDNEAGKSKSRIEREKEEERQRKKEEREKEEEEIQKQSQEQAVIKDQPKPDKKMEIRPTGMIYHDEDGDYSIAIGVKPSGMILDERQHGPKTQRMRIREAIANPKRTAEEVGQRGRYIHQEAKKALQTDQQGSQSINDEDRDLLDVPRAVTQNAKEGLNTAQDALAAIGGNLTTKEDSQKGDPDNGWKSSAFDL